MFSDAIMAIIMTILVLDLKIPAIQSGSNVHQYIIALAPLFPKIISFILSFIMIAIYWINHNNFFHYVEKVTIGFIWINTFWLLSLSFLPFPTSLLGAHPADQFPIMLYGFNLLICACCFFLLRKYAGKHNLLAADCNQRELLGPKQSLPAIILSLSAIILSFASVYLSLLCFAVFPIIYLIPKGSKH